MKKINNFTYIEKLIYEENGEFEQSLRLSRFVPINQSQERDNYFFYDCLCLSIVLLNRDKVRKWKSQQLMEQDFPFCINSYCPEHDLYKSYKKQWYIAIEKAKNICYFLNKKLSNSYLDSQLKNDLKNCIENINFMINTVEKNFLKPNTDKSDELTISELLIKNKNSSSSKKSEDKIINILSDNNDTLLKINHEKSVSNTDFTVINNFVQTLQSPNLFHELNFGEKHTNKVYLLLEKIFYNFGILSKYKIESMYEQVTKIDQYLVNHMKNIYLAQDFSMINIEEETVSILTKINHYLIQEIDKYLEQCIDNQLSLIDSIHNQFTKVNQV